MLKKHSQLVLGFLFLCDMVITGGSWLFAYYVRFDLLSESVFSVDPAKGRGYFPHYLMALPVIMAVCAVCFRYARMYLPRRFSSFFAEFADTVKQFTGKKGVDLILDHVGAKYLKPNMNSLDYQGKLVVIGVISGIKAELNLALMMVKRQQIIGSVLRSRPVAEKGEIIAEFTRRALPKFADRSIVPIIEKVFPIDKVVESHRMMEADRHFGKIVLKIAAV